MMAGGGGYLQQEGSEGTSGDPGRNPLTCYICKDYYTEPCLLSCYHTFCARCLQGKSLDNKLTCPICGNTTLLKDGCNIPPPDNLVRHLIELANTDNPPCSNCDKRDRSSMYFCSTCGQALCTSCRENTHRAKMFSTHEIVHMSKCSKDGHRRCLVHGEQYIMFSNSQRNMLCVNCFRDTPSDARLHCVDIDTAYTQGCKNLERAILGVREVQGLIRSGIVACKTLLDEIHLNTNSEKSTIHSFTQGMQEAIAKTQAAMLLEVQRQFESKERVLHSQLVGLSSLLPVLQSHLLLCHSFSSSATKFQFLDLVYPMIDRLTLVSQLSQPLRPLQTSIIRTNYKSEFAQSLEPWIGKPPPPPPHSARSSQSAQYAEDGNPMEQKKQAYHHVKSKSLDIDGQFSSHCRSFENQMKEVTAEVSGVRERLSQLQRDLAVLKRATLQPLVKRHLGIARDCERIDSTLQRYQTDLERLRATFDSLWQDQLRRIRLEQEIFQSQMGEVVRVRCEVKQLAAMAQELEPSVKRISQTTQEEFASLHSLIHQIQNISASDQTLLLDMPSKTHSGPPSEKGSHGKDLDHYSRSEHSLKGVFSHLMEKVRTKEERRKSPGSGGSGAGSGSEELREKLTLRDLPKAESKRDLAAAVAVAKHITQLKQDKSSSMYHSLKSVAQVGSQTPQGDEQHQQVSLPKKSCSGEDQYKQHKMREGGRNQRSKMPSRSCKEYQDEDSDYQHISEATTVHTRAHVHKSATPPAVYPHSDTEDSVFYPDTPSSGRRSSMDVMDRRKTMVIVIGHGKGRGKGGRGGSSMQKQRSWETFPPKRRQNGSKFCRDPDSFRGAFQATSLKKADSFEGHEEAVRTLVAAVQETRTLRKPKHQGGQSGQDTGSA